MSGVLQVLAHFGAAVNGIVTAVGAVTTALGLALPVLGRNQTRAVGKLVGRLLKAVAKAGQKRRIERMAATADDFLDGLISGLK